MNYTIITDEALLSEFIQNTLPELAPHEQFYCCLFARKKYCPDAGLKNDKAQLKRFTSTKEKLLCKIKQLQCPAGSYMAGDIEVPQEALALYISPNPRDLWKATLRSISQFAMLAEGEGRNSNPHQEVLSVIQRTKSKTHWVTFDIDEKGEEVLKKVDEALGGDMACRLVLETRGGYHVLVRPSLVPEGVRNSWHKKLAEMADVTGDAMIPMPGTYQGGFTPRFI
jgi:hypothetical protein